MCNDMRCPRHASSLMAAGWPWDLYQLSVMTILCDRVSRFLGRRRRVGDAGASSSGADRMATYPKWIRKSRRYRDTRPRLCEPHNSSVAAWRRNALRRDAAIPAHAAEAATDGVGAAALCARARKDRLSGLLGFRASRSLASATATSVMPPRMAASVSVQSMMSRCA